MLHLSDTLGDFRQLIVGENQGFKVGLPPDGFGGVAKLLFP
jgi:hypothetical protein